MIPFGGVIRDAAGNVYGTTELGGAYDYGAVFKVDASGNTTILYSFSGGTHDGQAPEAGLVRDNNGNLYGTLWAGPACGSVFKLDSAGNETLIYSFSCGTDGANPSAALIRDSAGSLYGTTSYGGDLSCGSGDGCGTVFQISPAGNETVLYSFTGGSDGVDPVGGLVRDAAGNLYGTTWFGGTSGNGIVFKIEADGVETVLYSFAGGTDGAAPLASLIQDASGNLYGTTSGGGAYGYGTIFEVDATGAETILHSFAGTGLDGAYPYSSLVRDSNGNLLGTTYEGGAYGKGTVFRMSLAGKMKLLHSFTGGTGGSFPFAGVIADPAGNLYGTTAHAGASTQGRRQGCGTVFKLTP